MRGVSTSPRSSSRSPAPSLPRGQAHSSPPTPTPRGPNTGRGPALLPARCQPQPSPAARPGMMLALQGFASYKTLGHGTPLPGRELELGAGGQDGHTQGSQCPRSQSPDRHWDRLAREGHRLQWQRTLEGTPAPGVIKVLQGHSLCLLPCCAVALCLLALLGLPWHPEGAGAVCLSQSCLAPYFGIQRVPAWQGDRET